MRIKEQETRLTLQEHDDDDDDDDDEEEDVSSCRLVQYIVIDLSRDHNGFVFKD